MKKKKKKSQAPYFHYYFQHCRIFNSIQSKGTYKYKKNIMLLLFFFFHLIFRINKKKYSMIDWRFQSQYMFSLLETLKVMSSFRNNCISNWILLCHTNYDTQKAQKATGLSCQGIKIILSIFMTLWKFQFHSIKIIKNRNIKKCIKIDRYFKL